MPDGLEQLRANLNAGRRAPIGELLDFDLVSVERGEVAIEGMPQKTVYNPIGSVHGCYAATLLDSACGLAVHSALDAEHSYTTLELKVSYLRALTDQSGTVRAEGRVISLGRRAGPLLFCETVSRTM